MTNWETTKASDFCLSVRDGTHDSPKRAEEGKYLITSRHIIGGEIDLTNAYLISNSDYDEVNRRSKVDRWDVLFTMIGTVGEVCLVKDEPNFAIKNIGLFKSKNELDGKWLYYFLQSKETKKFLDSLQRGTTQAYIPLGELRNLNILYPASISEAQNIISILSALDDKIENNRRMNETSEEMARAIFKSWFVDFDPVHAKAAGNAPAYMDADTAALFPTSFGDDGFPLGWSQKNVSEIFDFTMGQSPPGSTYNEKKNGIPFWQGRRDFGFRFPSNRVYCTAPTRFADEDDTLISVRAPVGDVNRALERSCIGRGVATLMHKSKLASYTYYTALQLRKQFKVHEASGTVFGSINKTEFGKLKIVFSGGGIEDMFEGLVSPLDSKILNTHLESETLENLRDTLLPKLMSGEIRVADAEREVEAL